MTNVEELEGTTLNVYSCMVKEDKPWVHAKPCASLD